MIRGYRGEIETPDGLVHLRNREYDPTTGQFLSVDPAAGVPGTTTIVNPYHYGNNDPVNHSDPLGLMATDDRLETVIAPPYLILGYGGYTSTPAVLAAINKRELTSAAFVADIEGMYQTSALHTSSNLGLGRVGGDTSLAEQFLNEFSGYRSGFFLTVVKTIEVRKVKGYYSYETHRRSELTFDDATGQYYAGDSALSGFAGQRKVSGYVVIFESAVGLGFNPNDPSDASDPTFGMPGELMHNATDKRTVFYPTGASAWEPLPASSVSGGTGYNWWSA